MIHASPRVSVIALVFAAGACVPSVSGQSAAFVKFDTVTQGSWKGIYGQDGAVIANDVTNVPAYVQLNLGTAGTYTWTTPTSDVRALQMGASSSRIASTFFGGGTLTLDFNFTDGQIHQVALYSLDWDQTGRSQTMTVVNANTQAVLDTRGISSFSTGEWVVWNLGGHVQIQCARITGPNAIVSGIFFKPSASGPPPTVSITAPSQGQSVQGTSVTLSATASSGAGIASVQFQLDGSNLGPPVTSSPYTTIWNSTTIANGSHNLTAVATDTLGQQTTSTSVSVTVSNPAPPPSSAVYKNTDISTQGNWKGKYGSDGYIIPLDSTNPPAYAIVNVTLANTYPWAASTADVRALLKGNSATDRIASTWYSSGSFNIDLNLTDGQNHQLAIYCIDWDSTDRNETISIRDANTNSLLDSRTAGSFNGGQYLIWNVSGHVTIQVTRNAGSNAVVSGIFLKPAVSAPPPTVSITAPTANQTVGGPVTISATASSSIGISSAQFQVDGSNLGSPIGAAPYSISWNTAGYSNGPHTLTAIATDTAGQSAISSAVPVTVSNAAAPPSAAVFLTQDNTAQGNWKNVYGQDGYLIEADSTNPPAYAIVNVTGANLFTWFGSTVDPRALLKTSSATDRIASAWYSATSFSIDLNLIDGQAHKLALYSVDWDSTVRSQTIAITDANTQQALDARTLSGFGNGAYLVWNITGHVILQITRTAGANAVVSGIFLSSPGSNVPPPSVSITSPAQGQTVSGSVQVTASASSPAGITRIQFLLDNANLGAPLTTPPYTTAWATTTSTNTSHTLTAVATAGNGQQSTSAPVTVTVNNLGSAVQDTNASDFAAGAGTNTYVSQMADGEVMQAPTVGTEFSGNSLPAGWTTSLFNPAGSATVANGVLALHAALVSVPFQSLSGSLDFAATFTADPDQHIGFGVDLQSPPWSLFSTASNSAVDARTSTGSAITNQVLAGTFTGASHHYRVDWMLNGFTYWVDGVQVAQHLTPISSPMHPMLSNEFLSSHVLNIDWLRESPYAQSATFTSRVLDAGSPVNWTNMVWTADIPAGATLVMSVRTGNTPTPDGAWTSFTNVSASGASVGNDSRYIQYRAVMSTSDTTLTVVLRDVTIAHQ